MIDSVILVTVKSRFAGRKFLTPEIRFSKLAPTPDSLREEVRREEMEEKPRNSSVDAEACWGVCEGAEVIIVMRVVARTLGGLSDGIGNGGKGLTV
jgi:hypothetical protein